VFKSPIVDVRWPGAVSRTLRTLLLWLVALVGGKERFEAVGSGESSTLNGVSDGGHSTCVLLPRWVSDEGFERGCNELHECTVESSA
jgi:hypothetical protein